MSGKKEIVRYKDTKLSIIVPSLDEVEQYGLAVLSEGLQRMRIILKNGEDADAVKALSAVTNTAKYITQRLEESRIPTDNDMEIDDNYEIGEDDA